MTAPISLPTLSAPQLAPQRASRLDGFAELLASIQDRRAARDIQREQLILDKRRVDQSEAMDKHSIEESNRKHDIEDRRLRASDAVDRYVAEALQDPHLSPTKISDIRARMVKENDKDLSPYLNEAFDAEFQSAQSTLKSVADRQTAENSAEVGTKTKANTIAQSTVDLDNAKLERTMRQMQADGFDAQRLAGAHDYARASGLPWGVVRKQFGLPHIKDGVADTFVFPNPSGKSGASTQTAQMSEQVRLANDNINALGNKGLSIAAYKALSSGPLTTGVINGLLSEDQQQLASAYASFMAPIQAVLVKGAASDRDVDRMQRAYVSLDSDATEVRAQKALIRTALSESFNPDGTNYEAMLDKFHTIIKEHGLDPKSPLVAPFLAMRPRLKAADAAKAAAAASGDDPTVTKMLGTPPAAKAAQKAMPRAGDVINRKPVTRPPR